MGSGQRVPTEVHAKTSPTAMRLEVRARTNGSSQETRRRQFRGRAPLGHTTKIPTEAHPVECRNRHGNHEYHRRHHIHFQQILFHDGRWKTPLWARGHGLGHMTHPAGRPERSRNARRPPMFRRLLHRHGHPCAHLERSGLSHQHQDHQQQAACATHVGKEVSRLTAWSRADIVNTHRGLCGLLGMDKPSPCWNPTPPRRWP